MRKRCRAIPLCFLAVLMLIASFPGVALAASTAEGLQYRDLGSYIEITGYTGTASTLEILAQINGKPVKNIGDKAFYGAMIYGITLPASLKNIGEWAFMGSHLMGVAIPGSATKIGESAFAQCANLRTAAVGKGISHLGKSMFMDCPTLQSVTLPAGLKDIAADAFAFCRALTQVNIPSSVTGIGDGAFRYCDKLTRISLPADTRSIGEEAFLYCTGLSSATLPSALKTIGGGAFCECNGIKKITVPANMTKIGDNAFGSCDSLAAITVDSRNAYFCSASGVLFDKKMTKLLSFPMAQKGPENYTIPLSVRTIGNLAFYNCPFTEFVVPGNVTTIDDRAFYACNTLEYLYIPPSVARIGEEAFFLSDNLIVFGYAGTYIQKYAQQNNVAFYSLGKPKTYSVTATANSKSLGTVTGGKKYTVDTLAVLTARPREGCRFVRWLDGKKTVGSVYQYQFIVKKSRSLKAEFAKIGVPVLVGAEPADNNGITLKWKPVTGAAGYDVYRSTRKSGGYTRIASVVGTKVTERGLPGATYYYEVRAYCVAGPVRMEGEFSDVLKLVLESPALNVKLQSAEEFAPEKP